MKKCVSAFAYLIRREPSTSSEILVVQRSANDRYFPNLWGIPAGTLRRNEGYEEAIRRTAKHRFGIEVEVLGERGSGISDRESGHLTAGVQAMIEVELLSHVDSRADVPSYSMHNPSKRLPAPPLAVWMFRRESPTKKEWPTRFN